MTTAATPSQIRLRANTTSGKAHDQYHGFCIGDSNQIQANVKKLSRQKCSGSQLRTMLTQLHNTIKANAANVICRAIEKEELSFPVQSEAFSPMRIRV